MSNVKSDYENDAVDEDSATGWHATAEAAIVVINVLAVLAGIVIIAGIDVPGRSAMAVLLFMLGPGSGIVQLIGRFDTAVRWILVVGLSVACSILTAQLLLSLGQLDSTWGPVLLTLVTAIGVLPRARRQ